MQFRSRTAQQNTQHPDEFQIKGLIGTSWQMEIWSAASINAPRAVQQSSF